MHKDYLPHDIVTTFIEGLSFSKNAETDLELAEQIAGNSYSDVAQLISVCIGYCGPKEINERIAEVTQHYKAYNTDMYEKWFANIPVQRLTEAQEKRELNKIGRELYGNHWDRWSRAHGIWKINVKGKFKEKYNYKPEIS